MQTSKSSRKAEDRSAPAERRQGIQSLEAGFRILRVLADAPGAMNLRDLARAAGMSPSKAHRYLVSLIKASAVRQDLATSRYDLGDFAIKLGLAGLNRRNEIRLVTEEALALNQRIDRTVLVSVWSERGPTVVAWYDASEVIICNISLGTIFPLLRTATGRVFLSYLPRKATADMVKRELKGIARLSPDVRLRSVGDVDRMIAEIRRKGYDMTRGELLPGLSAVAAPIFDHQGRIVAAMAALGVKGTLEHGGKRSVTEAVRFAAAELSHRLGGCAAGPRPSLVEWLEERSGSDNGAKPPPALRAAGGVK